MNAIILCAGFATRMYPLTRNFPKPLLEVGERPVMNYLLRQLEAIEDITDVHIVCNDKFYPQFISWADEVEQNKLFPSLKLQLYNDGSQENEGRLGAAGDLNFVLEQLSEPGELLVAGGDNIFLFPLKELWERFREQNCHCIPALYEDSLENLQKTGVLELDDEDRVVRLHEKPEKPPTHRVCPALYFFRPSVAGILSEFLKTPGNHDAPGYFVDYLCQNDKVKGLKLDSDRLDIGSLKTYEEADRMLTQDPQQALF